MKPELRQCEFPPGGGGPCLECSAWLDRDLTLGEAVEILVRDPRALGPFANDVDNVPLILELPPPERYRLRVDVQLFTDGMDRPELQAWIHPDTAMSALGLGDWWTSRDPIAWSDGTKPQEQMAPIYRLLGSWWSRACRAGNWKGAALEYEGGCEVFDTLRSQHPTALVTESMIARAAGWAIESTQGPFVIVNP